RGPIRPRQLFPTWPYLPLPCGRANQLVTTRSSKLRDGLLLFNARAKRKKCSNWRQSGQAMNEKPTFTLISVPHDRTGEPEYHPVSMVKAVELPILQLTFFILLPSILLSGFMFPFAGMPRPAQIIAEALPLTHFNRLIRGVMLRGASLEELSSELIVLAGFVVVLMTLAMMCFSKRLD
ncbi:MAG: ABC transporter permease, partial [Gammaproteobacteria bacterium]|nr:ABC transporter permease [Gammaproteobacteria bacterium]